MVTAATRPLLVVRRHVDLGRVGSSDLLPSLTRRIPPPLGRPRTDVSSRQRLQPTRTLRTDSCPTCRTKTTEGRVGRSGRPRPKRGEGQWALGYNEPLNKNEQSKKDDNPLNVRARILNIYSQRGFDSIDPADLRGRFRWMGLYTQRAPGFDGGKTAPLDEEELDDRVLHDAGAHRRRAARPAQRCARSARSPRPTPAAPPTSPTARTSSTTGSRSRTSRRSGSASRPSG